MTFFDMIRVLARRWLVVIPVALAGVLATVWVSGGVGAEYESVATVVFLPSAIYYEEVGDEILIEELNPYYFADVTRTLATTVPIAVGSTTTRQQAFELGLSPNYDLDLDFNEPILYISAKADTPEASWATLDFLLLEVSREVDRRQSTEADVPTAEHASVELLSEVRAIRDTSASVKVLGTLGVATLLATVMAGFAAEGWAQRRRMAAERSYDYTVAV